MIEVNKLSFSYKGNINYDIKDISFNVTKGEIFGFLGPSGAGKSTTQKIIIGLLKNYEGSVKVLNKEVKNISRDFYEKIGVGFELPNLYLRFTAYENLDYFRGMYKEDCEDIDCLLKLVGLENDRDKRVSDFSKGMKMRLNFARALLNKPEVIFLDEPTSGLDPVNSKRIKELIVNLKEQGKTIFITTHNMTVADEICDRVAFIVDGKVRVIDTPRNLKLKMGTREVNVEYLSNGSLEKTAFSLELIGENIDFLNILKGKEIQKIETNEATLEDVFIKVTGRELI